jgi:hypothetical protein
MTRTFLVAVDLDAISPEELAILSLEIQDACLDKGIEVTSVKPWEAPTLGPTQGYFQQPPTQQ